MIFYAVQDGKHILSDIMQEEDEVPESQKMIAIQRVLAESISMKNMLNLIRAVTNKHNDFAGITTKSVQKIHGLI